MFPLASMLKLSLPVPDKVKATALPSGSLASTDAIATPMAAFSAKEEALSVAAIVAGSSSLITLMVISSVVILTPSEISSITTNVELASKSKSPVRVTSPVSETVIRSLPLPLREYERALPSGSVALKVATTVPAGTVSDTLT